MSLVTIIASLLVFFVTSTKPIGVRNTSDSLVLGLLSAKISSAIMNALSLFTLNVSFYSPDNRRKHNVSLGIAAGHWLEMA